MDYIFFQFYLFYLNWIFFKGRRYINIVKGYPLKRCVVETLGNLGCQNKTSLQQQSKSGCQNKTSLQQQSKSDID